MEQQFFAPGRVNLIGEHTDYNMGFVLPAALSFGTYLKLSETETDTIEFRSKNYSFSISIRLDNLTEPVNNEWVNYPLGVISEFLKKSWKPKGLLLEYSGNIPDSAGLSSSASIEMVTAVALNQYMETPLSTLELVKLCQKAENDFVGVNCGIMDQFAVGFGARNKAIYLNCETLDYERVPLLLENHQLVVINSNKKRELSDSKYNERVDECATAVDRVQKMKKIRHLSELNLNDFRAVEHLFRIPTIKRRAYHIVTENYRVFEAVNALKKGKIELFGKLMYASHVSLRDNYEVTGFELDTIFEESKSIEGVIGARMTGAGFGGCAIALVEKSSVEAYQNKLGEAYTANTGLVPEFYLPEIGEGAAKIDLPA